MSAPKVGLRVTARDAAQTVIIDRTPAPAPAVAAEPTELPEEEPVPQEGGQ